MMILNMLSEWDSDKARTWSGTNWGLFCALKSYYTVNDININIKNPIYIRVLNKLGIQKPDMGVSRQNRQRKYVSSKILSNIGEDKYVLQFAEIIESSGHAHTYIYQDLSVDFVDYLYTQHPEVFAVSGFQDIPYEAIRCRRNIQQKYYEHCDGILTMSQWLKNDLIGRTGIDAAKVHHVGGGINVDSSLIDGSYKKGNKILFIGRDYIRKGLSVTMDAFKLLKEQDNSVEIHVAGPPTDPYLGQNIPGYYYYGECSHEKISQLLNKCDVFCMPSYFEAYGLAFIEALTYGLPCIGRNCYEMPYFIKDGVEGYLINNDDINTLASKIKDTLSNRLIKQSVLMRRPFYLKEYSWEGVAARINKYIQLPSNSK